MKKSYHLLTTWMDLKDIMLREISQTERDKYIMISLTCRILKQNKTKNSYREKDWTLPQVEGGWRGNWRKVDKRYKLPALKLVSSRDAMYT